MSSSNNINETKLYITNLPDNCDHNELKQLFQQYGKVLECVVMWNHYAFIHYSDSNEARNGLINLHGYLFNGKNLIVQYSTSSNRPQPKCKVFEKSKESKQNGLDFIKNYEKLVENSFCSQYEPLPASPPPATILCYRASDIELECDTDDAETSTACKFIEKDWIKFLSSSIMQTNNKNKNHVELTDIPTPEFPLITKLPSLDQIPTPPLPTELTVSNSSNDGIINKIYRTSDSSSIDASDYPISSSDSISPFTLSMDEEETEDIFETNGNLINKNKNEFDIFNSLKNIFDRDICW